MPQVNRALMVQLGIILLIVPVQYFISQRWRPSSHMKQQQIVKEFVTQLKAWKDSIFSIVTWKKWFNDAKNYMITYKDSAIEKAKQYATTTSSGLAAYQAGAEADLDDTAMEILKKRDPAGNFGSSAVPRNPRPANIKFRVGQVIRHKKYGYRGVIVGWDATAKAPENWLNQMHGKNRPVKHPQVKDYFNGFDGVQYIAKPWLKTLYPHDQ